MTREAPSKHRTTQAGADAAKPPAGARGGRIEDSPSEDPPDDEDPDLGENYGAINTTRSNIKNTS